ncbi:hypothetical protein [Nocardia arizonensis]|uniref:hypothetical protein n=1 Tax=Nocardia arizonensis TaxID=1141647 RepID=UPI0006D1806E|nr:hypothetical protein [Nocardia arizonensis]
MVARLFRPGGAPSSLISDFIREVPRPLQRREGEVDGEERDQCDAEQGQEPADRNGEDREHDDPRERGSADAAAQWWPPEGPPEPEGERVRGGHPGRFEIHCGRGDLGRGLKADFA